MRENLQGLRRTVDGQDRASLDHPFAFGFDQLPAVRVDTMNAVALRNAVVGQFAWLALMIQAEDLEIGGYDGLIAA